MKAFNNHIRPKVQADCTYPTGEMWLNLTPDPTSLVTKPPKERALWFVLCANVDASRISPACSEGQVLIHKQQSLRTWQTMEELWMLSTESGVKKNKMWAQNGRARHLHPPRRPWQKQVSRANSAKMKVGWVHWEPPIFSSDHPHDRPPSCHCPWSFSPSNLAHRKRALFSSGS